ncbi:hypothetical protein X975_12772, partial [Stegodyphus mimosarum]
MNNKPSRSDLQAGPLLKKNTFIFMRSWKIIVISVPKASRITIYFLFNHY